MRKDLVEKIIGKDVLDISHWEAKFPKRPTGTVATRFAPSPTGFLHIGGVSTALIAEHFAHQQNGVFMLRIEDTDTKREVEGATDLIIKSFADFGISFDEGPISETDEKGNYGPYFQSRRREIYLSGIKKLLENDLAYPCFCSEEELEKVRTEQTILKLRPGYYGKWAKYKHQTEEQIEENIDAGKPFIIRFKSSGNWEAKRVFEDCARGKISMPENDIDTVILKSDGLPTYHFAHVIDDHFMRTSHVIRGDEWLASLPLHVQMFEAIGFEIPNYIHLAPIQKLDDGNRRKLSKRKDPEANVEYYLEQGYPIEAIREYLMNLANSNFEDFKKEDPKNSIKNFELKLNNLNNSGPLLDFKKLENISKEYISTLSSIELFDMLLVWANEYDKILAKKMSDNETYVKSILAIERDGIEKVRKDFYILSKIHEEVSYFFDDEFSVAKEKLSLKMTDVKEIVSEYIKIYDHSDSKEDWFAKIKEIAAKLGYAKNPKEKEKNPDIYKGTVSDVASTLRVLITGQTQSPDLYAIMQVIGKDRTLKRIEKGI